MIIPTWCPLESQNTLYAQSNGTPFPDFLGGAAVFVLSEERAEFATDKI